MTTRSSAGFRRRTATLLQLNDNNSPTALDIGAYFSTGGDGQRPDGLPSNARTTGRSVSRSRGTVPFSRVDQVRFTLPADAQTLLDNLADGDRWIFKTARPTPVAVLTADAAFDGELAGDLAAGVDLGISPTVEVGAAFAGGLTGDLAAGVDLGQIPLPASADFTGGLDGALAPSVALGAAPGPHQAFDLGVNPFDAGADWLGALLIDPIFVVGGGTAYLRRFGISGSSTRLDVSESDTGGFSGAGPELVPEWENWENAIVFDADGGGITLKGPNHPDNSFSDPSEPYFWTPDNGSAFRNWYLTEPQNVTVRFNLAPAPDPVVAGAAFDGGLDGDLSGDVALGPMVEAIEADAAFDGELDGDLSAGVALGEAPDIAAGATFDGDLAGDLAAGVTLGGAPDLAITAAFTGDLDGDLAAGVALGGAPDLAVAAAFDGNLDGDLAGDVLLSGAPLVLANFDQTGLDMEWLAVFEAPAAIGTTGVLFGRAPRTVEGALLEGEAEVGAGDEPVTRILRFQNAAEELRFNDNGAFSWNAEYGSNGSATNRRFYLQTPEGSADWPFDGNVSAATASVLRLEVPTQHQTLVSGIAGGERFIMGFGNPSPLSTDAAFTGQLDGDLAAGVVLAAAPGLNLGTTFDGGLDGDLSAGVALGDASDLAAGATFDGDLAGDLSAGVALGAADSLSVGSTFDGDLIGDLAAGVALGTQATSFETDAAFTGDLAGTLAAGVVIIDLEDLLSQIGRPVAFEVTPGDGHVDLDFDSPRRGELTNIEYEVQIDGGAWVPLDQYLRQ